MLSSPKSPCSRPRLPARSPLPESKGSSWTAREARHRHVVVAGGREHEAQEAVEAGAVVVVGRDRVALGVVDDDDRVELAVRGVDVDAEPLPRRRPAHRVEVEVALRVAVRAVRPVADRRLRGGRAAAPAQAGLARQRDRPVVLRLGVERLGGRPPGRACPGSAPRAGGWSADPNAGISCAVASVSLLPRKSSGSSSSTSSGSAASALGAAAASRPAWPIVASSRTSSRRSRPSTGPAAGRSTGSRPCLAFENAPADLPGAVLGHLLHPKPLRGALSAAPRRADRAAGRSRHREHRRGRSGRHQPTRTPHPRLPPERFLDYSGNVTKRPESCVGDPTR